MTDASLDPDNAIWIEFPRNNDISVFMSSDFPLDMYEGPLIVTEEELAAAHLEVQALISTHGFEAVAKQLGVAVGTLRYAFAPNPRDTFVGPILEDESTQ